MVTAVDADVLLDVFTDDPTFGTRSLAIAPPDRSPLAEMPRERRARDATERLMALAAPYNGLTAKGAALGDLGRQAIATSEPLTLASPSGQHLTRSAVPVTAS